MSFPVSNWMEQKFQSSFIPKKQSEDKGFVIRAKKPMTMFYWLSMGLFFLTVILSGTLFAYKRFVLVKQLEQKKQQIQDEINSFDRELTNTLTILKRRVDAGEKLLSEHISVAPVFSLIESLAITKLFFNDFSFTATPGEDAKIEAHGEVPSYAALAFQSETLKQSDMILNPVFSELNLNDLGRVVFFLETGVAPSLVSYRTNILESQITEESPDTGATQETNEPSEETPDEAPTDTSNDI